MSRFLRKIGLRTHLYNSIAGCFPCTWKPLRYLLWGKVNFNDLNEWERAYNIQSDTELQQYRERIPNLVKAAAQLAEPFASVLEISAGLGNFVLKLEATKQRFATEYADKAIAYLQKEGIETRKAVLPEIPFADESVDIVVAISVFEHLASKKMVRQSFEVCHRVCREGMIFSVPFQCMEPWKTVIHNFHFSRADFLRYIEGLFEMTHWEIVTDDETYQRSLAFLRKIK